MSSLPVVRLSEHSMGSPFNGVKEVLSPVAALGYGMICFFLMNMWYYDMTKESCWYYDMSLDFMMRLIRHEYEIMLKSLYRWYLRLRTTWYRCIDTKWYKHIVSVDHFENLLSRSLQKAWKKSYLFGDRQISTEVVNEPVVVVCSASHILVLSYQCCRSEAMTSPAVPLWR